jgi:hypothetical protein
MVRSSGDGPVSDLGRRANQGPLPSTMNKRKFPKLLRSIYDSVDALEAMFRGRHFTPDGHMVGSLGEAFAAHYYGIELSRHL